MGAAVRQTHWVFLESYFHDFFFPPHNQDPDGVIAQREMNKSQGGGPQGGHGGMGGMDRMGPGPNGNMVNIPPSLMNNPNIPNEIIHGLQAGRIGNTVFVANVRLNFLKFSDYWQQIIILLGWIPMT